MIHGIKVLSNLAASQNTSVISTAPTQIDPSDFNNRMRNGGRISPSSCRITHADRKRIKEQDPTGREKETEWNEPDAKISGEDRKNSLSAREAEAVEAATAARVPRSGGFEQGSRAVAVRPCGYLNPRVVRCGVVVTVMRPWRPSWVHTGICHVCIAEWTRPSIQRNAPVACCFLSLQCNFFIFFYPASAGCNIAAKSDSTTHAHGCLRTGYGRGRQLEFWVQR